MSPTPDTYGDDATRGNLRLGPGTMLGVYRLDEPLGRGGMGMVWKAWDTAGQRFVAVKLLPPEFNGNEAAIGQVRDAFQVVHALTHQHIGKTIGLYDDAQFGPYIVMEYLPGIPLTQFAKKYRRPDGTLPLETVVEVLRPVAQALDYGHGKGVLHRDVKPDNILVEDKGGEPGDVWLIDYGLAAEIRATAVTHTNASVDTRGTRPYMAPEQFKGKRHLWDGRTDQYALAVVAYELLAGRKPFDADDEMALMLAIKSEEPDPVKQCSDAVNETLRHGLAKGLQDRFPRCVALVAELMLAAETPASSSRPRSRSQLSTAPRSKSTPSNASTRSVADKQPLSSPGAKLSPGKLPPWVVPTLWSLGALAVFLFVMFLCGGLVGYMTSANPNRRFDAIYDKDKNGSPTVPESSKGSSKGITKETKTYEFGEFGPATKSFDAEPKKAG